MGVIILNDNNLKTLSPNNKLYLNDDNSEYKYYRDILNNALTNDENRNIAFSGKYGSGKSSLIYSYLNDTSSSIDKNNTLKVNFSNLDTTGYGNSSNNKLINELSLSIINQIIYQINTDKIPKTHFKIKSSIKTFRKILLFFAILSVVLILGIHISKFQINVTIYNIVVILSAVLWSYLIFDIVQKVDPQKIKIGFSGLEASLNYENDDFFEKYIDEILYLFSGFESQNQKIWSKSNKKDYVLIIEDLDRLCNQNIFIRLKNLNIKLNQHSDKHWTFLYLIKDDMFNGKTERTKFFDLIIPVLPFLTSYNSYDKMRIFFGNNVDDNLLYYLSRFIGDYRLLLNIFNEYTIFNDLSNHSINNKNELLSLISYKNIYPSSFDEIQDGKGLMADIVRNHKPNIEKNIKEKEEEINDKEAHALYRFIDENGHRIEHHEYGYPQFLPIRSLEEAHNVINNDSLINLGNNENVKYSDLFLNNDNYKNNYLMHDYYLKEQRKLNMLRSYDLHYISRDIISPKDEAEKEEFDFIFPLISEGFITIGYLNTINFFYGNVNNELFMRKLYTHDDDFDINLNITDINNLTSRMLNKEYFFEYPQILNIDLFRYILENKEYDKARKIISISKKAKKESSGYLFIEKFLENNPDFISIIHELDNNLSIQISEFNFDEKTLNYIINKNIYTHNSANNKAIVSYCRSLSDNDVKWIINNDNVDLEVKKDISFDIGYVNLEEIKDYSLWNYLIEIDKVKYTLENAIKYNNEHKELDDNYFKFLNHIDFNKDVNMLNENNVDFVKKIILDNRISRDKSLEIISKYDLISFDADEVLNLSDSMFSFIYNNCDVDLNEEVFNRLVGSQIDIDSSSMCLDLIRMCNESNNVIRVTNKALLNFAKNNYDIDSFKFVTERLTDYSLKDEELITYLQKISEHLKNYSVSLSKVINIIKKRKNSRNAKIINDDSGIIINILDYLKELKIIDTYKFSEDLKKIKFH